MNTVFQSEGYFDCYNYGKAILSQNEEEYSQRRVEELTNSFYYEFVFIPTTGFLAGPDLLLPDSEVKLMFDRADPKVLAVDVTGTATLTSVELKNCYATTEYVSSPLTRTYFDSIDTDPILYKYDECEVLIKSLPLNEKNIRLDNLKGGNVPSFIFAAIIPTDALNGNLLKSSTGFYCHNVESFNFSLNGNSVNGYPVSIQHGSTCYPLHKFNDTINKMCNITSGSGFTLREFESNFIWSHSFEAESSTQGWIGVDMKLKSHFAESHSMVIWVINPTVLSIDKFHQIERINSN